MPELPEVETIRRGLASVVTGRRIDAVRVLASRSVRQHPGGPEDFAARLEGRTIGEPRRRGKYMWLPFADGDALVIHLGMSGQLRSESKQAAVHRHTRVVLELSGGRELRFVDQRMFGWMDLAPGGADLPASVAHVGRDLFDPELDLDALVASIARKRSGIKRVLLDQKTVSGIGNIYADESLWRAKVHGDHPSAALGKRKIRQVLACAREVMAEAIEVGGTSFDELYVNVHGDSGYFERSLNAYGRVDEPCPRCGTALVRERFTNRSSYRCPKCQKLPKGVVS